jgi:hypothetical protein
VNEAPEFLKEIHSAYIKPIETFFVLMLVSLDKKTKLNLPTLEEDYI